MPMLRTIKIAAIAVSMVNPVRSLGGKSAAACTVKVIRREAEVAAALMIFGNSGRHEVPPPGTGVWVTAATIAKGWPLVWTLMALFPLLTGFISLYGSIKGTED